MTDDQKSKVAELKALIAATATTSECVFRRDPATRSDATRPPIPMAPGHRFR